MKCEICEHGKAEFQCPECKIKICDSCCYDVDMTCNCRGPVFEKLKQREINHDEK